MKFLSPLLALLLISTQAFSAETVHLAGRWGLGFGGDLPIPIAFAPFRNNASLGWGVEGHGDYFLSNAFALELQYQHYTYQTGKPLNNTYTLGFNYRWFPIAVITPVLGVAAGWGTSTSKAGLDDGYSNFYADGKFGFAIALCESVFLEPSAKYSWLFSKIDGSRDQQSIVPQLNLTFVFGNGKHEAAPAMAPNPTPVPMPAMSTGVAPVDGDDDHDGVLNSVDKCPNTPPGVKVNSLGCPIDEKINQTVDIEFHTGKATIPSDYYAEVDKIVDLMKTHSDVKVEIQGYTDSVGSAEKNQKLSEQRANAVRSYLTHHGVEASRVTAKGYGEENPIADNTTAEGRKQNRREIASIESM